MMREYLTSAEHIAIDYLKKFTTISLKENKRFKKGVLSPFYFMHTLHPEKN